MGIVSYLENLMSTYLITCIFYVYYICQAEILMICLKWLEYMNKNYVQTNQYLENKSWEPQKKKKKFGRTKGGVIS